LGPVLAVQTKGPVLPTTAKLVDCPLQIIVLAGVILIESVGEMDTVATAVTVQAPVPDKTVYVVFEVGETVTLDALAGLAPALAVHVNGPVPVDVKVTLSPKQIVVLEGEILIGATGAIDTVAKAVAVQAPVPDNTV
jgi:hypothetical protein